LRRRSAQGCAHTGNHHQDEDHHQRGDADIHCLRQLVEASAARRAGELLSITSLLLINREQMAGSVVMAA